MREQAGMVEVWRQLVLVAKEVHKVTAAHSRVASAARLPVAIWFEVLFGSRISQRGRFEDDSMAAWKA